MIKTTLDIEGMVCGMCESHINDVIRKNFKVKKVNSSHSRNQTEIISEEELDEEAVRKAIDATGYKFMAMKAEPYERKGFSLFRR